MVKTKKISLVGGPCSGKSTLAQQINLQLKINNYSSVYVEEYVVDYISYCGASKIFEHQMVVFEEQCRKERNFDGLKDFIVCDSASWTSYIYGRSLVGPKLTPHDIIAINQLQRKVLETIDYWNYIFFLPMMQEYEFDGIRYQDKEESAKLGEKIKGWLEIENIPFYDLSNISINDRLDYVINIIT